MLPVMLIDRDPQYSQRLSSRLQDLLACTIHSQTTDHPKLDQEISVLADEGLLVLAEPTLCQTLQKLCPNLPYVCWIPWHEPTTGISNQSEKIHRLMPASQLAAALEQESETWSKIVSTSRPSSVPLNSLTLTLDLGWPSHRDWVKNWLSQQQLAGHEIYYLPLMPNYRMSLLNPPGSGPNLTQLLLRLANGEALSPSDLGPYLEPNPRGFWQFRPAERSDDLVLAEPDWLRSIVVLIRKMIQEHSQISNLADTSQHAVALIDCQGLSFSRITQLAVLADNLAVHLETGTDWSSQCAQRELGELIARLPGSCQILEIYTPDQTMQSYPRN